MFTMTDDIKYLDSVCARGSAYIDYIKLNPGKLPLFTFKFKDTRYRLHRNRIGIYQIIDAENPLSLILRVKSLCPSDLLEAINLLTISKIHDS